ncbi:MAG: hypothetical protein ACOZIN_14790 [Myxococcota bacterium]
MLFVSSGGFSALAQAKVSWTRFNALTGAFFIVLNRVLAVWGMPTLVRLGNRAAASGLRFTPDMPPQLLRPEPAPTPTPPAL